ncbi:winged helix-turn-helix transcriptional regulator [Marimonas sp. MJW-29]|uniref:Winged helix-turn-helix transcriptional regulator n=1 Tax=Sulfitobacter sediminis TaxID=3234186 RepID=A0ABV3RLV9_9RHOB
MKQYKQFCGAAYALDLLGERWTLLILRDLLVGPCRYKDLLEGLPGITTNLLAKRLRDLVAAGLVSKEDGGYALTPAGRRVEPVVLALAEFGSAYLDFPPAPDETVQTRNMVLNLKRRYRGGWIGSIALDFESGTYLVLGTESGLAIEASQGAAEVRLAQVNGGLARWIMASIPLQVLIDGRAVKVSGRRETALAFDACLRRETPR